MSPVAVHDPGDALRRALDLVVPPGARCLLDTSVLLAHVTGTEGISWAATRIVDEYLASGRNVGFISSVTLGEMLVRPMQVGGRAARTMVDMVWSMEGLSVKTADDLVAIEAARARAGTGIRMSDAMIVATAALTSSSVLITNDRVMATAVAQVLPELRVVLLSEVAAV